MNDAEKLNNNEIAAQYFSRELGRIERKLEYYYNNYLGAMSKYKRLSSLYNYPKRLISRKLHDVELEYERSTNAARGNLIGLLAVMMQALKDSFRQSGSELYRFKDVIREFVKVMCQQSHMSQHNFYNFVAAGALSKYQSTMEQLKELGIIKIVEDWPNILSKDKPYWQSRSFVNMLTDIFGVSKASDLQAFVNPLFDFRNFVNEYNQKSNNYLTFLQKGDCMRIGNDEYTDFSPESYRNKDCLSLYQNNYNIDWVGIDKDSWMYLTLGMINTINRLAKSKYFFPSWTAKKRGNQQSTIDKLPGEDNEQDR